MTIRNRELSQFGSFIYIENDTKDIGITTEATPFVGIGTTNATQKLDVRGNLRVSGGIYDSNNVVGAANSILVSTGTGISWSNNLDISVGDADTLDGGYNQNYYLGGIRALSAGDYIEVYGMVNAASGDAQINQQSTFFAYKIFE